MKCETTTLDIETIVNRIKNGDIDLQPDFQRGEIWTIPKRRKLIDSILRGWKIPPVHFVVGDEYVEEVLDGQQRLAAIRDFYCNKISVDGNIEPVEEELVKLQDFYYRDLAIEWQRRFRQYTVTIVRLTEYKPEEPAELFYRLNQPTALTSAEQRNAYMGETRNQIKELSDLFVSLGASKEVIGFSNSRLAYDEIISKFCYAIEKQTLKKKITSTDLSEQYRKGNPFSDKCIKIAEETIRKFFMCITKYGDHQFSFNKATLFSWLVFVRQNLSMNQVELTQVVFNFEFCRDYVKGKKRNDALLNINEYVRLQKVLPFFEVMLNTFNQRASMGSTDALSIIYRDIIIAIFHDALLNDKTELLDFALYTFEKAQNMNYVLESIVDKYNWGEHF